MSSSDLTGLPKLGNVLYQTLVEFPQSAYSVQRVPDQEEASSSVSTAATTTTTPPNTEMPHAKGNSVSSSSGHPTNFNIGEPLAQFCQSTDSISSLLAADPKLTPGQAWKKLSSHYKHHGHESQDIRGIGKGDVTDEQLEMAYRCGKWGNTRPSKLFLRVRSYYLCPKLSSDE